MPTRRTIARVALAAALLALAGVLGWVAGTRQTTGQPGALPVLLVALLPLAAAGLVFRRPVVGAILAVLAALLGAGVALALTFCLCPMPPLALEFVALYTAALVVFGLALLELVALGLAWLAIVIVVVVLAFAGTVGIVVAGLLVVALIARWKLQRRRLGPANGRTEG